MATGTVLLHTSGVLNPRSSIPQPKPLQTPGSPVRRRWWWGRPHPGWSFASLSVLEVLSSLASSLGDVSSRLLFASSGGYKNGNKTTQRTVFNIIPIKTTIKSLSSYMTSQYGGCGKVLLGQRQHTVTDEHLQTAEWGWVEETWTISTEILCCRDAYWLRSNKPASKHLNYGTVLSIKRVL